MNFHYYPVDSQIVVSGNDSEKVVLELRTNHLKLFQATTLSFYDTLCAPGVQYFLVSSIPKISFLFNLRLDVLDIIWHGDLFSHVTLRGVFN